MLTCRDAVDSGSRRSHNGIVAEFDQRQTRRVFLEDIRRDGRFLRCTWHPDRDAFVLSVWEDEVCVGATRIGTTDAAQLIAVLGEGLADAGRAADQGSNHSTV